MTVEPIRKPISPASISLRHLRCASTSGVWAILPSEPAVGVVLNTPECSVWRTLPKVVLLPNEPKGGDFAKRTQRR